MNDLFWNCVVVAISAYLCMDRYCDMREKIDDNQYEYKEDEGED